MTLTSLYTCPIFARQPREHPFSRLGPPSLGARSSIERGKVRLALLDQPHPFALVTPGLHQPRNQGLELLAEIGAVRKTEIFGGGYPVKSSLRAEKPELSANHSTFRRYSYVKDFYFTFVKKRLLQARLI